MAKICDSALWHYAAANYLFYWLKVDSCIVSAFSEEVTSKALHNLFSEYRVLRTIRGQGHERLAYFADYLNRAKRTWQPGSNPTDIIRASALDLGEYYRANCLSAVSKSFWMLLRHPVAIYDSYSLHALTQLRLVRTVGKYEDFYNGWHTYYVHDDTQRALNETCSWLMGSGYSSNVIAWGGATSENLQEWLRSDWFRNRIVDHRLLLLGNPRGADLVTYAELARFVSPV